MSNNKDKEKPEEKLTPGQILKAKRESLGISLDIVHESTKIPLDSLKAIEEGYRVRTMSPFYFRGFVKIYAKYLGAEIDEVMNEPPRVKMPPPMAKDEVDFDLSGWVTSFFTKERKRQILIGAMVLFGFFVVTKFIGCLMSRKPSAKIDKMVSSPSMKEPVAKDTQVPSRKEATKKNVTPPAVLPPKDETPPQVEQPRASVPESQPQKLTEQVNAGMPNVSKNILLTVRAKKNSWLRVSVDGQIVFQSTLIPGATESWQADESIEISGRNISQLEFELNGKWIGSLGREDRMATKVVVTKNGLSVTK